MQGSSVGYVTTDQLNTPRAVTNASQTIEWNWTSDPFGNGQPTGSLTYNLRFPGQYYDAETGHNYNYFRDYDASTGRYIESDPIGLGGGPNTYGYVGGNPISFSDQSGRLFGNAAAWATEAAAAVETSAAAAAAAVSAIPLALWPSSLANDELTPCQREDDLCRKAIADAQRIYNDLVTKRIPQYMYSSRIGESDPTHWDTIRQRQAALDDALRRVKLHCKQLPPDFDKWERLADQDFPVRH